MDRRTARPIVTIAALGVLLLLVAPPSSADGSDTPGRDTDGGETLTVDLTGADDRSVTVAPTQLTAPEQARGVGPGSHLLVTVPEGEGEETLAGCTASFIWDDGHSLYLGTAGHCLMPEDRTATDGPGADWDASDVVVRACVADCSFGGLSGFAITGELVELGEVAYARQVRVECTDDTLSGEEECSELAVGNDFGVVEIPDAVVDAGLVRTSVPVFGGPTGLGEILVGDPVCHYGAGVALGEVWPTMGRAGVGVFSDDIFFVFEGGVTPGDSGSAAETCGPSTEGLAGDGVLGTITHLTPIGPVGTMVQRGALMARCDAGLDLDLVLGDGSPLTLSGDCERLGDPSDGGDGGSGGNGGNGGNGGKGGNGGGPPDHAGPPEGRSSQRSR